MVAPRWLAGERGCGRALLALAEVDEGRRGVVKLRVPVCAAALGGEVEDGPEGVDVGCAAGVLAGVGGTVAHFATPEVADRAVAAGKDVEAGGVAIVGADVGAGEGAVEVGDEGEVAEAAFLLEGEEALDGGAGDDREGDAVRDAGRGAVPGGEERGADGAGCLALGAEHEAVDREGRFVGEEIGEVDGAVLAEEGVVCGDFAAGREGATEGGDALDVAAELDLSARRAVRAWR